MNTKTLLDAGKLHEAVTEAKQEVKSHPSDVQARTSLFELLCFAGDLEGAGRQLDVISHQDAMTVLGIEVYRNILKAEASRRKLFASGGEPAVPFDKPSYLPFHVQALTCLQEQNVEEAQSLLKRSEEERPTVTGRVNGERFSEFLDGDDRLGPFLEVILHQSYMWLPFEQIKHLSIAPPKHLRDLVWIPAEVEGTAGPIGPVFLPVLYVGSWQSKNDQVRLGRMTEWDSPGAGLTLGLGQRLFLIDGEDRGMLEVREVEFDRNEGNISS